MTGVVVCASLEDLKSVVVAIVKVGSDSPLERSTGGGSGKGSNGDQVAGRTLAEKNGARAAGVGGVGDGVGLTSLHAGGILVDGKASNGGNHGSARDNGLEETHGDGC